MNINYKQQSLNGSVIRLNGAALWTISDDLGLSTATTHQRINRVVTVASNRDDELIVMFESNRNLTYIGYIYGWLKT